jgi:hypothetical protein
MLDPWYIDEPEVIYPSEEPWFAFSCILRIHGEGLDFNEITKVLGVQPTHFHRKGEQHGRRPSVWRDDAWQYKPPIAESRPLTEHIEALWQVVRLQVPYLKALKRVFKVDVFCGYRSNNQTAGFEVEYRCLELFTALEVPFGVSVVTLE